MKEKKYRLNDNNQSFTRESKTCYQKVLWRWLFNMNTVLALVFEV